MAPAAQRRDLMRLRTGNDAHLTYCTNIHPGESWEEVRAALGAHVPEVKKKICPDEPFGVGLRLSGLAISQLSNPVARAELRELLEQNNLYVFTVNGFPHGNFHNTPVKEQVYRPDWSEEERLVYTDGIADLLSHITPEDADYSPSISTVPVGFRPRMNTNEAQEHAANRILRQAVRLDSIRRQSGKTITLALEPEPHCALETSSEAVAFFEDFLLSTSALNAIPELRDRPDEALEHIETSAFRSVMADDTREFFFEVAGWHGIPEFEDLRRRHREYLASERDKLLQLACGPDGFESWRPSAEDCGRTAAPPGPT